MKQCLLVLALLAASGAARADNVVSTDQVASFARAATQSAGSGSGGNVAYATQSGIGNDSSIIQTGNGNAAFVVQTGGNNSANVIQSGGGGVNLSQNGGEAVTITQTGMPGHVSITQTGAKR